MTSTILNNGKKGLLPLLNRLGKEIYTFKDILTLTKMNKPYAKQVLYKLDRADRLIRLEKGKYLFVPEGFEKSWTANSFLIASSLIKPYALSYWTALNHWHFTEQIPNTIFIQTTKRKLHPIKEILGVKYQFITLQKEKFFGLTHIWEKQHKIYITDKEKTIVDCFAYPEYCGGIIESVKGIVNGLSDKELDLLKLIKYAIKFGNKTVFKRLGYILETLNTDIPVSEMKLIKNNIGRGYTLLDPTLPKKGKLNYRWQLILNIPTESLKEWQKH